MPRREMNNPTERIRRILEEIEELQASYIFARDLIAEALPHRYHELGPEPNLENIAAERTRQGLTYAKVKYAREAVRRLRLRGVVEQHARFKANALPDWRSKRTELTPAQIAEVERDTERLANFGPTLKDWQVEPFMPCQMGKDGVCPMEDPENCVCLHPELR